MSVRYGDIDSADDIDGDDCDIFSPRYWYLGEHGGAEPGHQPTHQNTGRHFEVNLPNFTSSYNNICSLSSLEVLILSNNHLRKIPAGIGQLSRSDLLGNWILICFQVEAAGS